MFDLPIDLARRTDAGGSGVVEQIGAASGDGAPDGAGSGDGSGGDEFGRSCPAGAVDSLDPDPGRPRSALLQWSVAHGEVCEIGGLSVSVTELRRLLGESIMQLVLTNGEAVIDVVNLGRKPTVAQMIAKLFSDSCCTAEGCDRAVRLEFDHRNDWARVKVTELANLDLLCDHHHDLKT